VSVFHRPESKFYWYRFSIEGRRYRGSTTATDRTTAEVICGKKYLEVVEGRAPPPRKAPTLAEFCERFLNWVEGSNLQRKTKLYYRAGWRLLDQTRIVRLRLNEITSDCVASLHFPGSSSNTNCALRTLRRMLHKAQDWNLVRAVPKVKLVPECRRFLTLDRDAEDRLQRVGNQLLADIVVLLRDTGMRNERELYPLRAENIDWNRGMIFIPDSKSPVGRRSVPMSDRVLAVLSRRCEDKREGWVFPSRRSACGHLTTMAQTFRRARKKAGLPDKLVLYCSRHDFGTRILSKTGNLAVVMETMGHKDFQTAMKYQHPDIEIVRKVLNKNASRNILGKP
jgi:integrase